MVEDIPRSQTTIEESLRQQLREDFDEDIDLTQESVFTTLAEVIAAVLANNQEMSLQDVYESAFLDTATGDDLDRVVSLAGIQRRDAIHSTGVQRFVSASPVTQDYVIPNGTTVQTGGENPVQFETTEETTLHLFNDFENNNEISEMSGDVDKFALTTVDSYQGNQALSQTASSFGHIYHPDIDIKRGTQMHAYIKPETDEYPRLTFGVQDGRNFYQFGIDTTVGTASISKFEDFSTETIASSECSIVGEYCHVVIDYSLSGQLSFNVYTINEDGSEDPAGSALGFDSTWRGGSVGYAASGATDSRWDFYTTRYTSANIRAVEGGTVGNVGANTVTTMPSPIGGVNSTINRFSIGQTDYLDTDGIRYRSGDGRETDEQLRERARDSVSRGGDATADAILSTLLNDVEGVTSVTVFENKENVDNTNSGGLPPYSFEAVVYGGDAQLIAEALYDTRAVTSNDYGGSNGTEVTRTVVSDVNGQEFDISFSRPSEVSIDMTLDLIVTENYIGDSNLRDRITEYIGGVLSEGDDARGLEVSENVIIDQLRDIIVGEEDTGVRAMDQSVDTNPIETSPAITTEDGIEVISVGANEVAATDASDGSITINRRQQ